MRSAEDVRKSVQQLAPLLTARAADIETARRLPLEVLDALKGAGCFRLLHPPSHGGLGADLPSALEVYESLARADGAVGWTVMIGSGSWVDLATLPRATFDALFAGGGDVITAGAFNPTGTITPAGDAFVVDGRWGFASGCEHATWLFGNCIEGFVDGAPQLRAAVFSPDQITIEDTWNVVGLCGTGSHHFRADSVTVPAEQTFTPLAGEPCIDEPIVRIPPPPLFALAIASVALGIARGALDETTELATAKVPLLAMGPLATSPTFQHQLALADTEVRAARALVHDAAAEAWAIAEARGTFTLEHRARLRAAAVWAVERATAAVDAAYRSGAGTALYADSPLQRRLRDIHALTQHFLVRADTLLTAGAILAGLEPDLVVF